MGLRALGVAFPRAHRYEGAVRVGHTRTLHSERPLSLTWAVGPE